MNNEGKKMAQKTEKGKEKVEIIGVYIGGKPSSDYFGKDEKEKEGKGEFGLGKFFRNIIKALSSFVSEKKRKKRHETKKRVLERKEARRREIEKPKKAEERKPAKFLETSAEGKIEVLMRADRKKPEAEAAEEKKEEKRGIIEIAKEVLMEKSEEAKAKKAAVEKLRKGRVEERDREMAKERARIEAERKKAREERETKAAEEKRVREEKAAKEKAEKKLMEEKAKKEAEEKEAKEKKVAEEKKAREEKVPVGVRKEKVTGTISEFKAGELPQEKEKRLANLEDSYDKITQRLSEFERKERNVRLTAEDLEERKALIDSLNSLRLEMQALGRSIDAKLPSIEAAGMPATKTREEEVAEIQKMMAALKYEFYKRRVSEEEYKKRLFEYQQQIRELKNTEPAKKDEIKTRKFALPKKIFIRPKFTKIITREKPEEQQVDGVEEVVVEMEEVRAKKPVSGKPVAEVVNGGDGEKVEVLIADKSKGGKVSGKVPSSKIGQMIEARPSEKIDREKITELEKHVSELLKKHKLTHREINAEIAPVDKNKIIEDFDKLINLIDLEKRTKELMKEETAPKSESPLGKLMPAMTTTDMKKEKIKAIAKEITKYKIITDFDQVLQYVKAKGKTTDDKAMKELRLDKKRFYATCEVLEDNNLIRIEYPPIGPAIVYDAEYKKPEGKEKGNNKR